MKTHPLLLHPPSVQILPAVTHPFGLFQYLFHSSKLEAAHPSPCQVKISRAFVHQEFTDCQAQLRNGKPHEFHVSRTRGGGLYCRNGVWFDPSLSEGDSLTQGCGLGVGSSAGTENRDF